MRGNSQQGETGEPFDLWPEDIRASNVTPPVAILREQAALLGKKTKNLLRGEVGTAIYRSTIYHTFDVVVPGLGDYRYELFKILHEVLPYPVRIFSGPHPEGVHQLDTEQDFVAWLKWVLASEDTKRVIGALLAQVKS